MSGLPFQPIDAILLIPIAAAAILALLRDFRLGALINSLAGFATFVSALATCGIASSVSVEPDGP